MCELLTWMLTEKYEKELRPKLVSSRLTKGHIQCYCHVDRNTDGST